MKKQLKKKLKKNKRIFLFKITKKEYSSFENLSKDKSLIHSNRKFCIKNKFEDKVVYGGLLTAKLSNVLSKTVNGSHAISVSWNINFYKPVYIGDKIKIVMEKYKYFRSKKFMEKEIIIYKNKIKIASIKVVQKILD